DEGECFERFLDEAGLRLFRRPLDDTAPDGETVSERELFLNLANGLKGDGASAVQSATRLLQAMLQSPQFLYLIVQEPLNGTRALDEFELASRLSYFLWAGPPDRELLEAARAGELSESAQLREQVERMWQDRTRIERSWGTYLQEWSGVNSATVSDARREKMIAALRAFYLDHLDSSRSLFELLSTPSVRLSGEMAEDYGFAPQQDEVDVYALDDEAMPVGLLAQPGIIAGMSAGGNARITDRGLFIVSRMLCSELPELPATLSDAVDSFSGEVPEDASPREISELRMTDPACGNCHGTFDPMAYPLEVFDGAGRIQSEPGPVDGAIPALYTRLDAVPVGDAGEFSRELAGLELAQDCLVRNHLTFALGALFDHREAHVSYLADEARASGGSALALAQAIATSPLFREISAP
ncbi:MAG: DUF1592 domain-containing protein, partial [Myxococcota bacterium]